MKSFKFSVAAIALVLACVLVCSMNSHAVEGSDTFPKLTEKDKKRNKLYTDFVKLIDWKYCEIIIDDFGKRKIKLNEAQRKKFVTAFQAAKNPKYDYTDDTGEQLRILIRDGSLCLEIFVHYEAILAANYRIIESKELNRVIYSCLEKYEKDGQNRFLKQMRSTLEIGKKKAK